MRNAVIILSVIVTAYAEAPYHLPRPPPHLPSFNYQPSPPPAPAPPPPPPPPPVFAPAPPPTPPVFSPAPPPQPVFAPAPQPVFAPAPPVFAPAPQSPPVFAQAPPSQSHPQIFPPAPPAVPQPLPQYITQQATSQYQGYSYPQPSNGPSFAQTPQQTYIAQPQVQSQPIFAPAPPQPSYQHQQIHQHQQQTQQQYHYLTGPQPQAIPQPQPIPQQHHQVAPQPSYSYGTPQTQYSPIRPLPAIVSPQPVQAPIQYYQQQQYQGASYQQPEHQQVQSTQQLPVQNQNYNSDISSYQADSHQYNNAEQAQTHRDALDSVVVNRVQNIIKDNEHSSAKERGYLSLVSGVSLENAKPSLEILSFEHRSPLTGPSGGDSGSQATSSGSSSYSESASSNSISSDATSGFGFLPQTKPATSYGVPN